MNGGIRFEYSPGSFCITRCNLGGKLWKERSVGLTTTFPPRVRNAVAYVSRGAHHECSIRTQTLSQFYWYKVSQYGDYEFVYESSTPSPDYAADPLQGDSASSIPTVMTFSAHSRT